MMTLEQIRYELQDRRAKIVADAIGVRVATVIDIREGRIKDPRYSTIQRLSQYFENEALGQKGM